MAKEIIGKIDKRCIFRQTFRDESNVRASGGVNSGTGTITYSEGIANFTNGKLDYNIPLNGTYTVRAKVKLPTITDKYVFDFRTNSGTGYVYFSGSDILSSNTGTNYINGVATSSGVVINTWYDIVVSGITLASTITCVGSSYTSGYTNNSYELVEIYQGTLTANEVLNLYQNKQNIGLQNSKTQCSSGTELIVNANDRTFASGTTGNWTGTYKSTSFAASTEQAHSGTYSAKFVSDGTGAGEMRLSNTANNYVAANSEGGYLTAWVYSSLAGVTLSGRGLGNTTYASTASTTINGWQQLSVFVPDGVYATTSYATWFTIPSGATVYVDDVSWVKLTNNTYSEILRVDARNGVIANKYTNNFILSTSVRDNGSFETDTTSFWTSNGGTISYDGTEKALVSTCVSQYPSIRLNSYATVGKVYRVSFKAKSPTLTTDNMYGWSSTIAPRTVLSSPALSTSWQLYDLIFTQGIDTIFRLGFAVTSTGVVYFKDINIYEYIPAITNTSTSIVRSGRVWAMDFNGSTSKVDCGSYNDLTSDKTFIVWAYTRSRGEGLLGRIISNGNGALSKVTLRVPTTGTGYQYTADFSNYAYSADGTLLFNKWTLIILTRTSTGVTNFYINGALSGTANQASGTPAAGPFNITIGNAPDQSYTFDGALSNVRVINGILTAQEIAQIYQSEKSKYNL